MAKAEVEVIIGAKDQASSKLGKIGKNLDKMSGKFKKTGLAMIGMGTAIGAGLLALTNKYAKVGDEVAKMAKRTGWGTEALSELRHMADLSGTSLTSLESGMKRLSRSIVDASEGSAEYVDAFNRLNLSAEELIALPVEEQFWKVANALAGVENDTIKAATAMELFGRSGTDMLPMLADGTEAIADMRQEAHDLNIVFSEESAAAAEAFEDAKNNMKKSLEGLGASIAKVIMPKIQEFIEGITNIVGKMQDWAEVNPILAETLLKVVPALIGVGGLLFAMSKISTAIIGINTALVVMHGLMGPAGWIKLAAGLAIAGGTLAALGYMGMGPLSGLGKDKAPRGVSYTGTGAPPPPAKGTYWIMPGEEGYGSAPAPPSLQHGGIVTSPMLAQIGEAGPEAVIPLDRGGLGDTYNFYIAGSVTTETELVETVRRELILIKERNVTSGI